MTLTLAPVGARPLAARTIDHGAIARNVGRLIDAAGVPLMAVVKADGFGHGAVEVARTALVAGARWIGVATVDEALELRAAGIRAPLFAWLVDPWSAIEPAIRAGVTLSCGNLETLSAIAEAARAVNSRADIHLELDTGMARAGADAALWAELCAAASDDRVRDAVDVTGIWSHLALAGVPDGRGTASQTDALLEGLGVARAAGLAPSEIHLANSAGIFAHPTTHLTMVRSAAAIYGIETVEGHAFGLEPAMRVTSRVSQVRAIRAGTGVGYLHAWIAPDDTRLALVPVGYADGVPRSLSNGGWVAIGAERCRIRGAISMDQLVVEVSKNVSIGDEVVLLGDPRRIEPTVTQWAEIAGTLPHDILAGLGRRVAREHLPAFWQSAS